MLKEFHKKDNSNLTDIDVTHISETSSQSVLDDDLVQPIAFTLHQLISSNRSKAIYKQRLSLQNKQVFTSKSMPKISIGDYIARIKKYTKLEDSTLVISLIYIDRACKNKKLFLTELNIHRIIIASIIVAIKYNEDKFYSNVYYAKIGGLNLEQMNCLESEFLNFIEFSLFVDTKVYEKYEKNLMLFRK